MWSWSKAVDDLPIKQVEPPSIIEAVGAYLDARTVEQTRKTLVVLREVYEAVKQEPGHAH